MVDAAPRKGGRALLILITLIALVFLALAAFFWVRSNAGQDQIMDLEDTVTQLEAKIEAYESEEEEEVEERDPSEVTHLREQVLEADDSLCSHMYEYVDIDTLEEGYYVYGGLSADAIADVEIQEAIVPELVKGAGWTDQYFLEIERSMDRYRAQLVAQCNFDNRLYIALSSDFNGVVQMLEWQPAELITEARFAAYQPIDGVMDMAFWMFEDFTNTGEPVFSAGYGDAGHFWWQYYVLDSETMTSDLIETCTDVPVFDDNGDWTDEREITCDREYVPDGE